MADIKIVYNWIGPRGPIPNIELPNVLSLANVSEGASTTSYKFWSEDLWTMIFSRRKEFDLTPSAAIRDENTTFILPFTLQWRVAIDFCFLLNNGLFEYSHTPIHILHHIRMFKGYVLINDSVETFINFHHLNRITTYFQTAHIPLNKVLYLTGCMNAEEVYTSWIKLNNLDPNLHKINFIPFPVSFEGVTRAITDANHVEPIYDPERIPSKLFLCWNRRYRPHRISLSLLLDKLGLVDRSYVSMARSHPELPLDLFEQFVDYNFYPLMKYGVDQTAVESFVNKLPLILDNEQDNNKMVHDMKSETRPYYSDSLVSIVTETNFFDNEMSLTEKSAKPMKEKHPFIIVGLPGVLDVMRKLGFKTFSEFWSEEYDKIQNPGERMAEIIRVCQEISTWDQSKILDFRRRVKPILEHNYQRLKVKASDVAAAAIIDIIKGQ